MKYRIFFTSLCLFFMIQSYTKAEDVYNSFEKYHANRKRSSIEVDNFNHFTKDLDYYINYYNKTLKTKSVKNLDDQERIFYEFGVPVDLTVLSYIESELNSKATSGVGAAGVWQLMEAAGKEMGLTVDDWLDERYDPNLSTMAAARYLKMLGDKYKGNWVWAICAYNWGAGNLDGIINENTNFFTIKDKIPVETQQYLIKTLALIKVRTDMQSQFRKKGELLKKKKKKTRTIPVKGYFSVYGLVQQHPELTELTELNIRLRYGYVPLGKRYSLIVPTGLYEPIQDYIEQFDRTQQGYIRMYELFSSYVENLKKWWFKNKSADSV